MRKAAVVLPCVLGVVLFASAVLGQSFNVDYGDGFGVPPDEHGAGAGQPGHWNLVLGNDTTPVVLADLDGTPTAVTISTPDLPFGTASFDNPQTGDPEQSLLDDYLALHSTPATIVITGLEPGRYAIYTYAWSPDNPFGKCIVSLDGKDAQTVGGFWRGRYAQGLNYALQRTHVGSGDEVRIDVIGIPWGSVNGIQIVRLH